MSLVLIRASLWAAVILLLCASAVTDMRGRIIPNRIVLLVAAAGLALSLMTKPGLIWASLLVAITFILALGTLAHHNFLGGGDVKLLAAVTLLVPLNHIWLLLIAIALAGGILSGVYLAANYTLRPLPLSRRPAANAARATRASIGFLADERARIVTGQSVPYALAILGGVGFYVVSELYQCWYETSCSL